MFRIRRIYDDVLPVNRTALAEVREIFEQHFAGAPQDDIVNLPERLRNPFLKRFRTVLYVAENSRHRVIGFAILLHEPNLRFCFLDYLATAKSSPGRGIGAALYEYVRDEAATWDAEGLLFECLPDDSTRCPDSTQRKQNAARLKFYEQYGARPIVGTEYESPVPGGSDDNVPYLVYDSLDGDVKLRSSFLRKVVRAVLERKYSSLCPPEYVEKVVASISDPVKLRDFKYLTGQPPKVATRHSTEPIGLVINDRHDIHHIRERGYVESPVRIRSIGLELGSSGFVEPLSVREYGMEHILAVHDADFVDYLKRACEQVPEGKSVYPYVFPIRNATRPPKEWSVRAGYYCIDTFTPIHRNAFPAAKRAVDCVLTAADELLAGRQLCYALVRPPGHHAERRSFGGFCYFSNAAVGANYLSRFGRVAILDIDYHHGNGQQDIFYERKDVLTISIHGDPDFAYPYFTGFADECGAGDGTGFNVNFPLPEAQDGSQYRATLRRAIDVLQAFEPAFLVVALGLDPAKGDPTGTWSLLAKDFEQNGRMLGALKLPTLVVQEGGYRTRTLGRNAKSFFVGLVEAFHDF
jgi:acetoin utilization deacetylase AcuC-like enzyme/GNAT superfamily N-acetyltransferase